MKKKQLILAMQVALFTLTPGYLSAAPFTDEEIPTISDPDLLNAREPSDFSALTSEQIAQFHPSVLPGLTAPQVEHIPPDAASGFSEAQFDALLVEILLAFNDAQWQFFSESQREQIFGAFDHKTDSLSDDHVAPLLFTIDKFYQLDHIPLGLAQFLLNSGQLNDAQKETLQGIVDENTPSPPVNDPPPINDPPPPAPIDDPPPSDPNTPVASLTQADIDSLTEITLGDIIVIDGIVMIADQQLPDDLVAALITKIASFTDLSAVSAKFAEFLLDNDDPNALQLNSEQVAFLTGRLDLASGNLTVNDYCPEGTVLIAKFQGGDYSFEKPMGNEAIVTLSEDVDKAEGAWHSTQAISHLILKGGDNSGVYVYEPAATSGTFSQLILSHDDSSPDISHVQFCATPSAHDDAQNTITLEDGTIILISELDAYTLSQLSVKTIAALTALQIALIPSDACSGFTAAQIQSLSVDAMAVFSLEQMAALSLETIAALSAEQLTALKPEIIAMMGIDILKVMADSEVQKLSNLDLTWLILNHFDALSCSSDNEDKEDDEEDDEEDNEEEEDEEEDDDDEDNTSTCPNLNEHIDSFPEGWTLVEGKIQLTIEAFLELSTRQDLLVLLSKHLAWFAPLPVDSCQALSPDCNTPPIFDIKRLLTLDLATIQPADLPEGWEIVLVDGQLKFELSKEAVAQLPLDFFATLQASQIDSFVLTAIEYLSTLQFAQIKTDVLMQLDLDYLEKMVEKAYELPDELLTKLLVKLDKGQFKEKYQKKYGKAFAKELEKFYKKILPKGWKVKIKEKDGELHFKFKPDKKAFKYIDKQFAAWLDFEEEADETLIEWLELMNNEAVGGLEATQLQLLPKLPEPVSVKVFINHEAAPTAFLPATEALQKLALSTTEQMKLFFTLSGKPEVDSQQIAAVTPTDWTIDPMSGQITMTPQAVSKLTKDILKGLTKAQVKCFDPSVMAFLTAAQLSSIQPIAMSDLTSDHIARISLAAIKGLTASQVTYLDADAVSGFNVYHLLSLHRQVLAAFSPWQRIHMVRFVFPPAYLPVISDDTPPPEDEAPTEEVPDEDDANETAAPADTEIDPLDFGEVLIGESKEKIFTFSNTDTQTLTAGQATITGEAAFTIVEDTCSNQAIAASGTCQIKVVFQPQSTGDKTATLSVPFENAPQIDVPLNGIGIVNTV